MTCAPVRERRRHLTALTAAVVALCLALTGLTMQSAQAADTGSITGKVFTQATPTANLVPASGVTIYLYRSATATGYYESVDTNPATPGTDGFRFDGSAYALTGLKAGFYKFEVAGVSDRNYQREYYNDAESLGGADYIQVGTQTVSGKNVVLEPAGQITGKVTDRAGKPLANASISFEDSERGGGAYATTDANGNFTSAKNPANGFGAGLVRGDYRVAASKYSYGSDDAPTYEQRYWKNSATYAGATPVTVVPGQSTAPITIVLDVAPRINLTVKDAAGRPLRDSPVGIYVSDNGVWGPIQSGPHTTNANGVYRKTMRIGDKYKFFITPPAHVGGVTKWFSNAYTVTDATEVTADAYGQVRNIEIRLDPAPTVTGTVRTGKALVAKPSAGSPLKTNLTYQWVAGGAAIRGATRATFKVSNAEAGKSIAVRITGQLSDLTTRTETSAVTSKAVGVLSTSKVSIRGTAKVGKTLRASTKSWGPKPVTLSYRWYRNGKSISGQKKSSYKLRKADQGKRITVRVTQKKSNYLSADRLSAKTAKVKKK